MKNFTINWLNAKISNFGYSYLDRDNKPEEITRTQIYEAAALKQTAAGLLTLNPATAQGGNPPPKELQLKGS